MKNIKKISPKDQENLDKETEKFFRNVNQKGKEFNLEPLFEGITQKVSDLGVNLDKFTQDFSALELLDDERYEKILVKLDELNVPSTPVVAFDKDVEKRILDSVNSKKDVDLTPILDAVGHVVDLAEDLSVGMDDQKREIGTLEASVSALWTRVNDNSEILDRFDELESLVRVLQDIKPERINRTRTVVKEVEVSKNTLNPYVVYFMLFLSIWLSVFSFTQ